MVKGSIYYLDHQIKNFSKFISKSKKKKKAQNNIFFLKKKRNIRRFLRLYKQHGISLHPQYFKKQETHKADEQIFIYLGKLCLSTEYGDRDISFNKFQFGHQRRLSF